MNIVKEIKVQFKKVKNYLLFLFENKKLFGEITYKKNKLKIKLSNKKDNKLINTLLYHDKEQKEDEFLMKKFYYITYSSNKKFNTLSNFYKLFEIHYIWAMNPFKHIRYLISNGTQNIFPLLIRSTSPFISFIYIANKEHDLDFLQVHYEQIDIVLYKSDLKLNEIPLRCSIPFKLQEDINDILQDTINNLSIEKHNYINIFDKKSKLKKHELKEYSDFDGLIILKKDINANSSKFSNIIEFLEEEVITIYLRENIHFKYQNFCKKEKVKELLQYSLADGVRYEHITY